MYNVILNENIGEIIFYYHSPKRYHMYEFRYNELDWNVQNEVIRLFDNIGRRHENRNMWPWACFLDLLWYFKKICEYTSALITKTRLLKWSQKWLKKNHKLFSIIPIKIQSSTIDVKIYVKRRRPRLAISLL